jgi:hypothetical protein
MKKRIDTPHIGEANNREDGRSSFRFLECKKVQVDAESGNRIAPQRSFENGQEQSPIE